MATTSGTLPVLIDVTLESTIEGGPLGGQTLVERRYWNRYWDNSTGAWFILFAITYWFWINIYVGTWVPIFKNI